MSCIRAKRLKSCKKKKKVVEKLSEVRIEKWPSVLKVMYDLDKSTSRGVVGMKA